MCVHLCCMEVTPPQPTHTHLIFLSPLFAFRLHSPDADQHGGNALHYRVIVCIYEVPLNWVAIIALWFLDWIHC